MTDKDQIRFMAENLKSIILEQKDAFENIRNAGRLEESLCDVLESINFLNESLDGKHDDFIPKEIKLKMQSKVIDYMSDIITYEEARYKVYHIMSDIELFEEYQDSIGPEDLESDPLFVQVNDILSGMELVKVVNE